MAAFQFPDPSVQQTVVNSITGSTYQWKEPPGKWVVTVSVRKVEDIVYEGDNPPIPRGDYKLWYSTDTLELYFWYEDENGNGAWVPTSAPITMLEDLDEGLFEVRQDLIATNVAVRENENRIGRTIEYSDIAPTIYPETEVTTDIKDIDGITVIGQNTEYFFNELNYKFWYDTDRLELLVLYKDPDDGAYSYVPVSIPLESLPEPGVSTETFTYTTGRLQTAIEENYLHNLNQDTSISEIKNEIIELEEEIDAIAPSVERGTWQMTLSGTTSSRGQLTMYDDTFGQGGPIGVFKQVKSIWFHEEDTSGTPHGFSNVEPGNLLELFVEGEPDYGLFEVVEVHDETSPPTPYYAIDVSFVRALSDTSKADNNDLVRMKTFQAPTGGTADGFVLKTGDDMSGDLIFKSTNNGGDVYGNNAATNKIVFENKDSNGAVRSLSLFQTGTSNELKTTASFRSGNILCSGMYYGCSDSGGFHPSTIKLSSTEGQLRWSNDVQLGWNAAGITANKPIELSANGFATKDEHVVHKGYVDSKSLIQVLPGNPANPQVGDAWFSTNQNTLIIKIA